MFSYTVSAIRTTSTNEQTGAHECAAQLGITASNTGQTNEIPITYTVEMTDNDEDLRLMFMAYKPSPNKHSQQDSKTAASLWFLSLRRGR